MEVNDLFRSFLLQIDEPIIIFTNSNSFDHEEIQPRFYVNKEFWGFFGLKETSNFVDVIKVVLSISSLQNCISQSLSQKETSEVELICRRWTQDKEVTIPIRCNVSSSIENGEVKSLLWFRTKKETEDWKIWTQAFPHLMWTTDPNGEADFLSKTWLEYTGLTEEEALRSGWMRSMHPQSKLIESWKEAVREKPPLWSHEALFRRHDGVYRWFLFRGMPRLDRNNNVVRWYGSCTDIDDSKKAEEERKLAVDNYQKSEARFRRLFECEMMGIIITSHEGSIRQANSHFQNLFGYKNEELRERNINWKDLTTLGHNEVQDNALKELEEKGYCAPFETQFMLKEGKEIFALMGLVGMLHEVVAFVIDITKQKEAEQQALQASATKSLFVANVSHEIRTPLNAICGMIELLMDSHLNSQQKDYAKTILKSSETLRQLIHDILDFSKIEANKTVLENNEFSVKFLVEDIVEMLGETANTKNIDLIANVELKHDALIGDAAKLRQVLFNLIGNSIKFTNKGVVTVTAKTSEENEEYEMVLFTVEDTGMGISEENQKKLFQPFFQANSHIPGTGLGLSISKQLVELMGGDITVESQVGVGSSFSFTVRFKKAANPPKENIPHSCSAAHAIIYQPNEKFRKIIISYLKKIGITYQEIGDSESVVEIMKNMAREENHVILVTDGQLNLDYLLGILSKVSKETLKKFKILVTGQGSCEKQFEPVNIECLYKPIYFSKFMKSICGMVRTEEEANAAKTPESTPKEMRDDKLILLAEDNKVNQKVARYQLEKLGYRSVVADDGIAVLKLLRENNHHFSVILMDCQMPNMDGLACSKEIREMERIEGKPRIPILALTAFDYSDYTTKCAEAGMDDFISKPTTMHELKEKIEKWST